MTNVRPVRSDALVVSGAQWVEYTTQLEAWCDNIEQLHANQASNIAGYMADVGRLTEQVANLQRLNDNQRNAINEMIETRSKNEATIESLTLDIEEGDAARRLAIRERDAAVADVELIGKALLDEAVKRSWCDEYEEFIDETNPTLSTPRLSSRKVAYTVRHEYTVTLVGTVYALDDDHAERVARDQYRQIREDKFFSVPTEDDLVDTGEIVDVEYSKTNTITIRDED